MNITDFGEVLYEVRDYHAVSVPDSTMSIRLVPKTISQESILRCVKIAMDIGNANVEAGVAADYSVTITPINDYHVVELWGLDGETKRV